MNNYLKLLSFLQGHKKIFGVAVLFMLLSSIFEGVQFTLLMPLVDIVFTQKQIIPPESSPQFLKDIADTLNQITPNEMLRLLPVPIVALLVIKHLVSFWYGYFMNDVSQRVMRDIRNRLYDKIQNLSLDYYSKKRTGELISRITHDVQVIENTVSYGVTDLFRQTFLIIVFLTVVFTVHYKGALFIFLMIPFIAIPMRQIGKKLKKLSRSSQERMADINSLLLETISGVKVVKAFSTENYEIGRFKKHNLDYYKLKMKSIKRLLFISPITEIVGMIFGVIIIVSFAQDIIDQKFSFGVFATFFGCLMSLISPIKKLGNVNALTQQALSANDRIYEVFDTPVTVVEKNDAKNLSVIQNQISLENVNFQYDQESGIVLKDINLEIKRGDLVAIVGPTGTGKSTLVNLIPRFYDPTDGVVKVDGINLKDVSFQSLRGQIGIVTQETILFNDTVKANISYGFQEATEQQIQQAATQAFAHRFITKMPQGYDTVIGDRGFRLSGGEKQRIAIARAILKNPPILILDEATSQLDSESEKYVQEALDKLMQGRTVVAIAHRLSTIKKAKKIVVLDQGGIVGMGPHEELLKSCNLYRRLYETQFQING